MTHLLLLFIIIIGSIEHENYFASRQQLQLVLGLQFLVILDQIKCMQIKLPATEKR